MALQKRRLTLIAVIGVLIFMLLHIVACVPNEPAEPPKDDGTTQQPTDKDDGKQEDEWEKFTPTVNGSELLSVNKNRYLQGEQIYITAKGEGDAWVGLYLSTDDSSSVDSIKWYYVAREGFVSGVTYAFTRSAHSNASRGDVQNLPAGNYKFILFGDEAGSNVMSTVDIEISAETLKIPQAPVKLQYKLDNATDGLADGTLRVTFAENHCAEEVVLYWANAKGPLSDYTALAPFAVTQRVNDLQMYKNTVIPPKATMLYAYAKNSAGLSADCCKLELPENCQYSFAGKVLESFQVVSDIHIALINDHLESQSTKEMHDSHLRAMCEDIITFDKLSSAVFVVGDIANSGLSSEWKHASEIFAEYGSLPQTYFSLGNHDLFGSDSYDVSLGMFKQYAKTDSVYYEKEINGYHHLILGSESKNNGLDADLSQAQLEWFDSRLSAITSQNPDRPVFVYLHQSLYNTIAGSFEGQGWDGVVQNDKLKAIVAKYPQIYMFNGHSHWDLNTRGSMHDKSDGLPNIFNTASVAYLWSSFYTPKGEYVEGSQGYYIQIYKNKVLVLGRDFVTNRWIPSACFEAKI